MLLATSLTAESDHQPLGHKRQIGIHQIPRCNVQVLHRHQHESQVHLGQFRCIHKERVEQGDKRVDVFQKQDPRTDSKSFRYSSTGGNSSQTKKTTETPKTTEPPKTEAAAEAKTEPPATEAKTEAAETTPAKTEAAKTVGAPPKTEATEATRAEAKTEEAKTAAPTEKTEAATTGTLILPIHRPNLILR